MKNPLFVFVAVILVAVMVYVFIKSTINPENFTKSETQAVPETIQNEQNLAGSQRDTSVSSPPVVKRSFLLGWKTYANQKYSFEFRYPSHWIFCDSKDQTCNERRSDTDIDAPWIQDRYLLCDEIISPTIQDGYPFPAGCKNTHFQVIVGTAFEPNPFLEMTLASTNTKEEVIVGGVIAKKYSWVGPEPEGIGYSPYPIFEFTWDDYTYSVTPQTDEALKNIDQIISSFRFIQ